MKLTRTLAAALAALTLTAFSGCNSGEEVDPPDTDMEITAPQADVALVAGGVSNYTIVRSDTAQDDMTVKAAVLLRTYLKKCGVDVGITTDWEKNPVSEYEIVVGETLRTAEQGNTVDLHDFGEKGYYAYLSANRIYIGGGSDAAVYAGVEAFLTEFFGYTGDPEAAKPVADVTIPGSYSLRVPQEFAITSFTVAGTPLTDFRIRVDSLSFDDRNHAQVLQKRLYTECGIWLEIVAKDEPWEGPALIFSADAPKNKDNYEISVQDGNLVFCTDVKGGHIRGMNFFFQDTITGKSGEVALQANYTYSAPIGKYVLYSEFGAVGDGKTNDMAAIIAAHKHANENGIPVKADEGATYYISVADSGAVIQTDTDWTGASFIIDDSQVGIDKRSVNIFNVTSTKASYSLNGKITAVQRDATNLGLTLPEESIVVLTEAGTKRYIREGANQNSGSDQTDIIVVKPNGDIDMNAPLIWDYTNITSISVTPMDTEPLTLKGGTFTTIANQAESAYNYYARGIRIARSNTVVDGLTHYVTGEGDHGAPYSGILSINNCANITVQNCVFTGHKTYKTIGAAGTTVSMGTYDISPSKVVNLTFQNCTQTTDILNTTYWGIMGSNFCKNIVVDTCEFSRFDAHQGVANVTILNSRLGHQCLNAIGCGILRVEGSTLYGNSFINLRSDYGSTWEGEVIIKDCTWVPNKGNGVGNNHAVIAGSYSGFHDFGYPCYMPAKITIDGLHIDDSKRTSNYKGIYILGNIVSKNTNEAYEQSMTYPYQVPVSVTISNLTTDSERTWNLSPNSFMYRNVEVTEIP